MAMRENLQTIDRHIVDVDLEKVSLDHLPIYELEAALLKMPQVDLPIDHEFCKGLYARTMYIPAGVALTGAVHKDECFFVVRKGTLIVSTDHGPAQIDQGFMCITQANSKRAGFAITDVEVTTFHANPENETDPQIIWDMYTIPAPSNQLEADKTTGET